MNTADHFASLLEKKWAKKSLEELRIEAERETTGIAFESIRHAEGQRFVIALCVTNIDLIAQIEKSLDLVDDGVLEDWNDLTLVAIAIRTACGKGFAFESVRDEFGRRSALALIASNPHSIGLIESLFKFPN